MFSNNPYAQAGWHNPQNPQSINNGPWHPNAPYPPTYGALPPLHDKPQSILIFTFSYFNPDVFNCVVTGPKDRKYFEVRTSSSTTIISKPGEDFATIQWGRHPSVEARGVTPRQLTKDFLRLSADQTYRSMTVGSRTFSWIPRGGQGIYLYSHGPNPPEQYARISLAPDNSQIVLEITSEAFQASLFEPCVISTILLFSARNID